MGRNDTIDTKTLGVIILTVLALIVIGQNMQIVSFNFLFWKISMSRIIVVIFMLAMFVLGFLSGRHLRR